MCFLADQAKILRTNTNLKIASCTKITIKKLMQKPRQFGAFLDQKMNVSDSVKIWHAFGKISGKSETRKNYLFLFQM